MCMCAWAYECIPLECRYLWGPEAGDEFQETEVLWAAQWGVGNWTWVLFKSCVVLRRWAITSVNPLPFLMGICYCVAFLVYFLDISPFSGGHILF